MTLGIPRTIFIFMLLILVLMINARIGLAHQLSVEWIAFFASLVISLLVYVILKLNKVPVQKYLALHAFSMKKLVLALVFLIIYFLAMVMFFELINIDIAQKNLIKLIENSGSIYFFYFVMVIAVPIYEEVIFRGFLFREFKHSVLGLKAAYLVPAILFTFMHTQYTWHYLPFIFIAAILLSVAREKLNSLYATILLHAFWNLVNLLLLQLRS